MIDFTVYGADVVGKSDNCLYPHRFSVTDKDTFSEAIKKDHVTAKYKNNYRKGENFEYSDCIPLDCDNDHSDNPDEWITPVDLSAAMNDVCFAVSYSRHNGIVKENKSARPRFHVFFPVETISDGVEYALMKRRIVDAFPYFDTNALDSARFLFGTDAKVEFFEGSKTILDFLDEDDDNFTDFDNSTREIHEGSRNSTMSVIAARLIKRYGNTDEAYGLYLQKAQDCNPPLEDAELNTIWRSACKFGNKVAKQEGYIPPEEYNLNCSLKPADYSDVGQATVLAREYSKMLRYSPSTDYLVYNGSFWEESGPKAQGVSQQLTERQLEEAEIEIRKTGKELERTGALALIKSMGKNKAPGFFNKEQLRAYSLYNEALDYRKYAIKRRDTKYITAALKEGRPKLEIDQNSLDADEFLLNTPGCTYDLRRGLKNPLEHNPEHFITKQTAVDPSDEGSDIWNKAVETFFLND